MRIASKAIVLIFLLLGTLLGYLAYKRTVLSLIKVVLICFIPFVIVTAVRRMIDAPRPYELYGFYENKPKGKNGKSFPSRHVYSAAVISTLLLFECLPLGISAAVLSVMLAVFRVLLGIHFVRDTVCGGVIGIGAALVGVLILAPFSI